MATPKSHHLPLGQPHRILDFIRHQRHQPHANWQHTPVRTIPHPQPHHLQNKWKRTYPRQNYGSHPISTRTQTMDGTRRQRRRQHMATHPTLHISPPCLTPPQPRSTMLRNPFKDNIRNTRLLLSLHVTPNNVCRCKRQSYTHTHCFNPSIHISINTSLHRRVCLLLPFTIFCIRHCSRLVQHRRFL